MNASVYRRESPFDSLFTILAVLEKMRYTCSKTGILIILLQLPIWLKEKYKYSASCDFY
jgi:hypothetical protein